MNWYPLLDVILLTLFVYGDALEEKVWTIYLGDDLNIDCYHGNAKKDLIKWIKPMEGARHRDDGSIQFSKPSLGDSGHYICRSMAGREVHHYVTVVYQPDSLTAVHTLHYKMKDACETIDKQLKELMKDVEYKVLCRKGIGGKCPYTLTRSCESKSPAYGGFKYRLLLRLSVAIAVTSKGQLIPLIQHTKMDDLADIRREAPILLSLGGNETLVGDSVMTFLEKKTLPKTVLLDEDKMEVRPPNPTFEGNCKYNGSRLLDMVCAPCQNGHYSVKKSPAELTSPLCPACASMSSQPYFGATDCKSKPARVDAVLPPSTAPPPSTPSASGVLEISVQSVSAMTVPQLGGAVIAAILVCGLLGYLFVAVIKAMLRTRRKKGAKDKSLPSYHSLMEEDGDDLDSNYSIKSYRSITSNK